MTQCPCCRRTVGFKAPGDLCGTCEAYAQKYHRKAAKSEGTASAQRINAAPLPVRCPFHPDLCNWPEGECAGLCSLKRPQP